ncbi:MAG: hypothetical protein JST48_11555 [Bacteroidetes bacterium]|nr:hypothetical protein [Bacteroidota bacterium]
MNRFLMAVLLVSFANLASAQRHSVSIDSLFKISLSTNEDSVVQANVTVLAARIVDSLKSDFNYRFIENFKNNNRVNTDFKVRGLIREATEVELKNYFPLQKTYCIQIDLIDNRTHNLVETNAVFVKNLSVLLNRQQLYSSLQFVMPEVLKSIAR